MAPQNAINNINSLHSFARQAVVNGNFNIAQRGTSFTNPANSDITLDRCRLGIANTGTLPTNIIHTQQALTVGDIPNSRYFYRINPDGAGSGIGANDTYRVDQIIKRGTEFLAGAGKTLTLSFYARSSLASKKLGLGLGQYYGTGGAPTSQEILTGTNVTLTSSWTQYSFTFTTNTLVGKTFGTNNDNALVLHLAISWGATRGASEYGAGSSETFGGSGTIDIAQVQLCAGSVALPFQPKTWEQDLLECQADYYKTFPYATAPATNTGVTTGALSYTAHVAGVSTDSVYKGFPVTMSTSPTITFYNPSAANTKWRNTTDAGDSATPATQFLGDNGVLVTNAQVATDGVGELIAVHLTAATGF